MKKRTFCLVFIIAFTVLVAVTGGYFVNTSSPWYGSLKLPSFMPPSALFIVAWTLIYIFTCVAAFLECSNGNSSLLYVYALNGALNALWPYVFFFKENIVFGLYIIFALIITVIYLIRNSSDGRSKILLIPYLFWLFIAVILNYSIFMLN